METGLPRIPATPVTNPRIGSRPDRQDSDGGAFAGHLDEPEADEPQDEAPTRGDRSVAGPDEDEAGARLDVAG